MTATLHGELAKIRTAPILVALPAAAVLYAAVSLLPVLGVPTTEIAGTTLDDVVRGPASFVAVAMLVLGALVVTSELRHGTIVATLAVVPDRRRLGVAKALAVAGVSAVSAAAASAVAAGCGAALLTAHELPLGAAGDAVLTAWGSVAVAVLYGVAGVGVGFVLRDQTAAVAVALAWVTVVEGVVPIVLRAPTLVKWLPRGAASAAVTVGGGNGDALAPAAGLAVVAAYAALVALTGLRLFDTRDVR